MYNVDPIHPYYPPNDIEPIMPPYPHDDYDYYKYDYSCGMWKITALPFVESNKPNLFFTKEEAIGFFKASQARQG